MDATIEAAAAATTPTPTTPTTPVADTTPSTPVTTFESGGSVNTDKLQWVAIGIFSLTMIALVYKAVYYKKAISFLNNDNKSTQTKLKELEQNVRALRKEKYEQLS
jgi:hypothetical protein